MMLGAFLGLMHLAWSLLVAAGLAQMLIDFILKLHFIKPIFSLSPFELRTAVTLVIVTSALGYFFGWVLAAIWNRLHTTA